jgi:Flp pilus assembly protein TadG
MKQIQKAEKGQSIVLIVFGLVAMLAFTGMAIDGGMVYADRRHMQNAADQASLAGALAYIQASSNHNATAIAAAAASATANGYTNGVNGDTVTIAVTTPAANMFWDQIPEDRIVTVAITHETQTSFIQLVFGGQLINNVRAIARAKDAAPPFDGNAIVALGNCAADGSLAQSVGYSGGGNSGGVRAYGGSIFINSTETGTNGCGLDPGNTGYGSYSDVGIRSVGADDYSGEPQIDPNPISTGINDGDAVHDPMAGLAEPTCTGAAVYNAGTDSWSPGNIAGTDIDDATLEPGIFCVSGLIQATGSESLIGEGVVIVLLDAGITYTGNGTLDISAPTESNCLGSFGDSTASCTYKGIVIWVKRTNSSDLEIGGNGIYRVEGLVYAPNSTLNAHGGGSSPEEAIFQGQIIVKSVFNNGNGTADVNYVEGNIYKLPPQIDLAR